ncbi:type IX secretion/gliding motility protein PorT/SprT [Porphyromonas loveana]|uniref:type IX secretion/gliding motility protein PorT/SprT n=1 Tax=Porphyromonas loveana TaxID=1884669 RepID=UPI004039E099
MTSRYTSRFPKRISLLLMCLLGLLFTQALQAQTEKVQNRPYADFKRYHLGFHVGMHVQDLAINNNGFVPEGSTAGPIYAQISNYSPGFSVGVIGDMFLMPNLNLRVLPTLHFGDKQFVYSDGEKAVASFSVRSNYLEFPLLLKYSSRRLNNFRPYLIGGPYWTMELGRKKGLEIYTKSNDYGVQIGIGCDFYLRYFKFCPELRFSFGFPDVITHDRPDFVDDPKIIYTQSIDRAQTRMIMLTFNFE